MLCVSAAPRYLRLGISSFNCRSHFTVMHRHDSNRGGSQQTSIKQGKLLADARQTACKLWRTGF